MQACSINSMPAGRFMRDMFVVRGTNCKYGLYRFALICFGMCGVPVNFPPGGRQPPPTQIAKLSKRVERVCVFVHIGFPSRCFGMCRGTGGYRMVSDARRQETSRDTPSIIKYSNGVNGRLGSHPLKVAIPGDGPHLQKSIVDKFRCGSLWVRWGLFWASPSAGIAGWVLGKINLNE